MGQSEFFPIVKLQDCHTGLAVPWSPAGSVQWAEPVRVAGGCPVQPQSSPEPEAWEGPGVLITPHLIKGFTLVQTK